MKDWVVNWDIDPEIFWITDTFPLKYYGLMWVLGLSIGYYIVKLIYLKEKVSIEKLDRLVTYVFLGAFLGARLGHCLFYEAEYYLSNPLEILLPFHISDGTFQFIGFQGLASHGGGIGTLVGITIYAIREKISLLWILDRVSISVPVLGVFIRIGNLMNSEIYGKPTNGNWGFVFQRDDLIPRHPTQIYEAISYLLIFGLLVLLYNSEKIRNSKGILLGALFITLFSARFIIEFFKENQVPFEDAMLLNMGQILSIPYILFGLFIIIIHKISWMKLRVCDFTKRFEQ